MNLRNRIERLERRIGVRSIEPSEYTVHESSDPERFWYTHGCFPEELRGKITRSVRQYTDGGYRVTITLEPLE